MVAVKKMPQVPPQVYWSSWASDSLAADQIWEWRERDRDWAFHKKKACILGNRDIQDRNKWQ